MKSIPSEAIIWVGGIGLAGLLVLSTSGLRLGPDWAEVLCNQDKAAVAEAAVGHLIAELVRPSSLVIGPEKPVATYKGECVFRVRGSVRLTDPSGGQSTWKFDGDVKLLPTPMVWKNVSLKLN